MLVYDSSWRKIINIKTLRKQGMSIILKYKRENIKLSTLKISPVLFLLRFTIITLFLISFKSYIKD